jgi:hypothetical protein
MEERKSNVNKGRHKVEYCIPILLHTNNPTLDDSNSWGDGDSSLLAVCRPTLSRVQHAYFL